MFSRSLNLQRGHEQTHRPLVVLYLSCFSPVKGIKSTDKITRDEPILAENLHQLWKDDRKDSRDFTIDLHEAARASRSQNDPHTRLSKVADPQGRESPSL